MYSAPEALRCESHSFHTANTLHLLLPVSRSLSPEGATSSDSSHLIIAYYSFIDPERTES